ncbi:Sin3 family co-repressor-domain-containing protein [Phycomyces blakesleeanus]|uniref:Sin3 family co-repressor-domain-containing protein n=1 Tax=Phycomyces blakesleeanus TaxID=4837 RepID=A0ABR3AX68_PHYBL
MPSNAHGSISIAATMNTDSSLWTPIANHTKNMSIANKQGYKPLNPADALVYLELVKKTYADKPAVYQNLIEIMKDFKNKRTDIVKVIETITVLFKDYPFLIIGFNPFLPPGYRVECNQTENGLVVQTSLPMGQTKTTTILPTDTANSLQQKHQKQPMSLQDAFAYTTKLKERFGEDSDTYRSFVGILRKFQKKQVSTEQVYWSICKLFKDSEDLFKLFIEFLPPLESTTEPRCTSDQHKKRAEESLDDLPQPKRSKHDHPSQPPISDLRSTSPTPQNVLANDEERFFERARKHIGNKTTFNAFLKVINLFNQQIIDENLAAHRAEAFLGGNPSLFQSFKALLNYNEPDHSLLYAYAQAASPEDKKYECGPSYRAASLSWRKQQCSGRDPLCWEVLNTDYVSHPTWASEDSGFTASKKNQYEEALHVIEEARYAYDMDIQANTTTVDHLKKVTETLSTMTEKKQKAYRLPPDFGGPSPSIYSCAIKKVYGNEKGQDMIKLLQTDPAQTIPGVLKRLVHTGEVLQKGKQRQTELWKEAEIKNYYRALDHQGINFKKKDKKANSVKRLVSEIEALRLEQATKQQREPTDGYNDLPDPQYTFIFEDQAVLKDVIHILLFVLERNLLYGAKDCNRIRGFLSLFLPTLFDIDLFNEDTQSHQKATENTRQSEIEGETRTGRGGRAGKTEITGRAERACRGKRGEMGKMGEKGEREETHHLTTTFVSDPTQSRRPSFFGNSGFYCFVRLFQMVYTRLLDIKALDLEYKRNVNQAKYATTAEFDVGLKTREMESKARFSPLSCFSC